MNFLQAIATLYGIALFAEFFLYVNRNNPVRHVFLALYGYMFYLYVQMSLVGIEIDRLNSDNLLLLEKIEKLSMLEHCLVANMELSNHTHGQVM